MANSPRQFKTLTYTATTVTAVLLLVGIALTVHALTFERGSIPFTAALMLGQASLVLAVVTGVAAILVRRSLARRLPPSERADT